MPETPARCLAAVLLLTCSLAQAQTNALTPPEPAREFRAAWIASVFNIDWPSSKTLTPEQQRQELVAIYDQLVRLKFNAVVLQVRPVCDALYPSPYEPWSEYLTGEIGRPPVPYYDPLEFAVKEAHKRGLELHAWFNPYRAKVRTASPLPPNHVSRARPELVRQYGKFLWLDPGEPRVQDYTLNVIHDVVQRYDIDGVHFDDYFYPYQERDEAGALIDFPDEPSWKQYRETGGTLSRADWRRESVNALVRRCYETIKDEKPWVKFGISPFGIWKPGAPETIRGLSAYDALYADSRKWFAEGWVDYLAPQLYWNIEPPEQSYPVLLRWWAQQNKQLRHLWPGISVSRVDRTRPASEIINQILLTRKQNGASGNVHWSVKSVIRNQGGIADLLVKHVYDTPALVPSSGWLSQSTPEKPRLTCRHGQQGLQAEWREGSAEVPWLWVLQVRRNSEWETEILPVERRSREWNLRKAGAPEIIAIRAVNRYGHLSEPEVFEVPRS